MKGQIRDGKMHLHILLVNIWILIAAQVHSQTTYDFVDDQYFVFEGDEVDITMIRSATGVACTAGVTFPDGAPNVNNPNGMDDLTLASGFDFVFLAADDAVTGATMTAVADNIANEGIECFELAIESPTGSCIGDLGFIPTISLCVIDRTPLFYIEEAQYIAKERSDLVIRIRRAGYQHHADGTVMVDIEVLGITATGSGTDFTEPIQTASFDAGIDWVEKVIPITRDDIKEDIETFTIQLLNPVMGVIDQPAVAMAYIFDESAWVFIEKAQYVIGERGGTLTVRIRRGGYLWDDNGVSVDLIVADGTATAGDDFISPVTGNAIFSTGDDSVDMVFTISEDDLVEDTESFTITLTNPSGVFIDEPSVSTVFIEDQTAWFYIEKSCYIVGERSGSLSIHIGRGGYKDDSITDYVDISVQDITATVDVDYVKPVTTRATFGMDVNYFDMTFTINTDDMEENLESFSVTLQNPLGGTIIQPQIATVFIIDESVWFHLEDSMYLVGEREGSLTIRVRKGGYQSAASTASVDVSVQDVTATGSTSVATGIDYTPTGVTTLIFNEGVDFVDLTFNIIFPDDAVEDVERFTVTLQNPVGGFISTNDPDTATVYILDETAWFYVEKDSYTVGEQRGTMTVRIRRGGYSGGTATVSFDIADGTAILASDFSSPVPVTVTFSPGVDYVDVDFTILQDNIIEDKEYFTISLTNPQGGVIGTLGSTTVHIEDQTATFWVEEKQCIANEGQIIDIVFHRRGYLGRVDALTLSAIDGTASLTADYSLPDDMTISFAEGSTTVSKSLMIHQDNLLEHWEDFTLTADIGTVSGQRGVLYSPIRCTVFIRDPTWYNFDAAEYIVWEHESTILVGVERGGDIRRSGRVAINVEDGSATANKDYSTVETPTIIEFAVGVRQVLVSLTIQNDDSYERDEVFIIALRDPGSGAAIGNIHKAVVRILDDDELEGASINWILIASMAAILALLILAMFIACLCYLRLARKSKPTTQIVERVQEPSFLQDTELTYGPELLSLPDSVRYNYPALN